MWHGCHGSPAVLGTDMQNMYGTCTCKYLYHHTCSCVLNRESCVLFLLQLCVCVCACMHACTVCLAQKPFSSYRVLLLSCRSFGEHYLETVMCISNFFILQMCMFSDLLM